MSEPHDPLEQTPKAKTTPAEGEVVTATTVSVDAMPATADDLPASGAATTASGADLPPSSGTPESRTSRTSQEASAPRKSGAPPDDDSIEGVPTEGEIIAGKYKVERVLGKGGMGIVVAARHASLRQHVAVKFLLPKAMTLPGAVERFLREARAAVAIKSEHVARVIDVGELETGAPYMVMEYLTGIDFGKMLRKNGPLPVQDAADYILQACEALAEAHALGIVHRDLKPGNLFLTKRADGSPLVKVLDFGLSKATKPGEDGAHEHSLTATDVVVGSPHYMSPEQLKSLKLVDTRADVWAIGVILYQLLSGRRPFEGESMVATCARIAAEAPTPLHEFKPDAPPELEKVILRCLEKDKEKRLQSVADLARLLAPFGSERAPISVERIVRVIEGESSVALKLTDKDVRAQDVTGALSAWNKTQAHVRKNPSATLFALAAAAAFALAIVLLLRGSTPQTGSVSAATTNEAPKPAAPTASPAPDTTAVAASPVATVAATAAPEPGSSAAAPEASSDPSPEASSDPAASENDSAPTGAAKRPPKPKPGATSAPAGTQAPVKGPKPKVADDQMLDKWN